VVKRWSLWIGMSIWKLGEEVVGSKKREIIGVKGDSKVAKIKMLNHLKKVLICNPKHNFVIATMFPDSPNKKENRAELIVRPKNKFSNRRLLRIKNTDKVLVQGYGSETLDELGH